MGKSASPMPSTRSTRQTDARTVAMSWAFSSQTPSSAQKPSKQPRTAEESPLADRVLSAANRHAFASSPIKKAPLPSPSPDRVASKSSPTKAARSELRKKVMFTKDLIHDATQPRVPTPRKPILKNTASLSSPPHMQELTASKAPRDVTPDMPQFWSPGNIPRLNQPGVSNDINGFKTLFMGGLSVLKSDDCNRQFEIYATFNLLFKDLTDKRASIVATHLSELLPILQKDVVRIESTIFDEQIADPFLTRADVQIIKLCTVILSNTKIQTHIHNLNVKMKDFVLWAVTHSCIVITRSDTSKSLLSANLQLLKDQKLHSLVLPGIQEYMLSSVMKMKYIHSASLVGEKLNTIKALIINCSPMMEKNVKVWLPFILNCLCDFSSPLYIKTISVASIVLLEAAKVFINSKAVMFEMRSVMASPITKTLNIQPESQLSFVSTPVDLYQFTLLYVTLRLSDLLDQGQVKLALDVWIGLSVLLLGDPAFLKFNLTSDSMWYRIIHRCLTNTNKESKELAIKAWRVLVYSLTNALENLPKDNFNEFVSLMLSVFYFDEGVLPLKEFAAPISNVFTQVCYAMLNSVKLAEVSSTIIHCLIAVLKRFLDSESPELADYTSKILAHVLSAQLPSKDYATLLAKVMSSDPFDMREIRPLHSLSVFKCHSALLKFFTEQVWPNNDIQYRVKSSILSSLMTRLKGVLSLDFGPACVPHLCKMIDDDYKSFFSVYIKTLSETSDQDTMVEHVNKFIILLKTTFGPLCTAREADKKEMTYLKENIYISIISETLKYPCKTTEVLKYLLSHIKAYRLPFFEDLVLSLNEKNINQYITNNLESMIFEKPFTNADALALSHTVRRIPKTIMLFKSYFVAISKSPMPGIYIGELSLKTWTFQDITILWSYVSKKFPSVEPSVIDAVSSQLQEKDAVYAKGMIDYIVREVPLEGLARFKEHVLFHAIDYHGVYDAGDHEILFMLFKLYIDRVGNVSEVDRDGILQHGINLSLSLLKMQDSGTALLLRVSKVLHYIVKNIDDSSAYDSNEFGEAMSLTKKARAAFEDDKRNLSLALPLDCLEVFGWSIPSDREIVNNVAVDAFKDSQDEDLRPTLPTQDIETGFKDTLPIAVGPVDAPAAASEQDDTTSSSVLDVFIPSTAVLQDSSSSSLKDTLVIDPPTTKTLETTDGEAVKSAQAQESFNTESSEKDIGAEIQVFSSDKSANTSQEGLGLGPTQSIDCDASSLRKIQLISPTKSKDSFGSQGPTQVIQEVESSPKISKSGSVELTSRPLPSVAEGLAMTFGDEEEEVSEDDVDVVDNIGDKTDSSEEVEDDIVEEKAVGEDQEVIEDSGDSEKDTSIESIDRQIGSSPMKEQRDDHEANPAASDEGSNDSDCELIEIDDLEFQKSFSPKRKKRSAKSKPQKRQHIEEEEKDEDSLVSPMVSYSSPTPKPRQAHPDGIPAIPISNPVIRSSIPMSSISPFVVEPIKEVPVPIVSSFNTIRGFLDGITDDQVASLDDREVFEVENKLLALMMKMRSRR